MRADSGLHGAATRADADEIRRLLAVQADPGEAVILGDGGPRHVAVVRLLVEARAAVDLADRQGVTPLARARARGYAEMVRILEDASRR
jgi:ankyrin repeat protein